MKGPRQSGDEMCDPFDSLTRREVLTKSIAIGLAMAIRPHRASGDPQQRDLAGVASSKDLLAQQFRKPPLEYAPVDNWWWEAGHVEKAKLSQQLQEMKDRGIGGTWFYPRWVYGEATGLGSDPAYWTPEWWELTRFSVEEHKRLGLTHFFSNWTLTQFQQNLVREEKAVNPRLGGRALKLYRRDSSGMLEIGREDEILEAAAYRRNGTGIDYSSRKVLTDAVRDRKLEWRAPGPDWILTLIAAQPWDLNYLDAAVGQRYAEIFLEEYAKRLPEFIGSTLESFGADEMILLNGRIPYSRELLSRLQAERGYQLAPHLIGLFYDVGAKTDQFRCDYYGVMSAMLEENFYRPPSAWLERRGMKHATLSQLGAGDPLNQTVQLGDFFRYMRSFHITGNEDPFRTKPGGRRLLATKLSSSVTHLYDKRRVELCVHYSAGWGMTQEENLAWTNESYAKGANLYTRHGNQYTLMGGWYEWVPSSDHFYQPTWRYWGTFTRYITRLSFLLSQGKHRPDVALLYPITTIHAHWVAAWDMQGWPLDEALINEGKGPFNPPAIVASQSWQDLAHAIYEDGIDFDFMDNESLERATIRGGILEVAGVEFRSLVLPALTTIRLACMRKVREFYEAGGTVLAYGRLPTASAENGRDDPQLRTLVEGIFGGGSEETGGQTFMRASVQGGRAFFVPNDVEHVPALLAEAIVRDVAAPEKDLFHLHKRVADVDVYFLFNVREETRDLPVRFRAHGNVEIWDAFTGEARPEYRWRLVDDGLTEIQLRMERNEGVVVVFSPGEATPSVLEDNVAELVKIEPRAGQLSVQGFDAVGGRKRVRVRHAGQEYEAKGAVQAPPSKIVLADPFEFRLEPTMNNRWGDFRYPATNTLIGAEARQFRYAEEEDVPTAEREWHRADLDDSAWPEVTYSYGPYWWHIGGFAEGSEPKEIMEQAKSGSIDLQQPWDMGDKVARWQRYGFSQKFGAQKDVPKDDYQGLLGVIENFIALDQPAPGNDTHYLLTYAQAPAAGDYVLHVGVKPERSNFSLPYPLPSPPLPSRVRAWVDGAELSLDIRTNHLADRAVVRLRQGWNTVLIEVVRPESGMVAFYAALLRGEEPKQERYVPLLSWFREPQPLIYDITPQKARRIGWYRFKAPPGMRAMSLQTSGRVLQAWVDGEPVSIDGGRITRRAARTRVSQVALRIEQAPGAYSGAAFSEPIAFECENGLIALGDWSSQGLATYSGIGVYGRELRLNKAHLRGKVLLDLGTAKSVAEVFVNGRSAGVKLTRPFRFDITELVSEGSNRIEIKVANTLANHMSTYPTQWVLEGQTVSGLMGPVELSFHSPVRLTAQKI